MLVDNGARDFRKGAERKTIVKLVHEKGVSRFEIMFGKKTFESIGVIQMDDLSKYIWKQMQQRVKRGSSKDVGREIRIGKECWARGKSMIRQWAVTCKTKRKHGGHHCHTRSMCGCDCSWSWCRHCSSL